MNALSLLSELVKAIVLFINPKQNMTTVQRVGSFLSILTLLGMLAGAVNALLPVDVPTPQNPAQDVLPVGDVYPDVPGDESASVGILGLLGAAIVSPIGCSGAQIESIKVSSADLLACFANIGAHEATVALEKWGQGYKINAEDLGADALGKALPCLLRFGAVAVSTYVLPSGRWGGSAGEKNVYRGDGYEIVISPKRK